MIGIQLGKTPPIDELVANSKVMMRLLKKAMKCKTLADFEVVCGKSLTSSQVEGIWHFKMMYKDKAVETMKAINDRLLESFKTVK